MRRVRHPEPGATQRTEDAPSDTGTRRRQRWALPLLGIAAVASALHAADGAASSGVLLAFLSPILEWVFAGVAAVEPPVARAVALASPPVAVALLGVALWLRRRRALGPGVGAPLALGIAAGGQALVMAGSPALGALLYAASAALFAAGGAGRNAAQLRPLGPVAFAAGLGAVVAAFLLLALFVLDVYPDVMLDEEAYLVAARMTLGELPEGPILQPPLQTVYILERFQAQPIPLALQAAAVALASPGVIATRLLSVALGVCTLVVLATAIRRPLGDRGALLVALCVATSPWMLFVHRTGLYLPATILHASVAFVLVARWSQRLDRRRAVAAGAWLGSSIHLYQLSWFVPLVAGLSLLAGGRRLWSPPSLRTWLPAGAAALAVALPSLLSPGSGVQQLIDQSLPKATTLGAGTDRTRFGGIVADPGVDDRELQRFVDAVVAEGGAARLMGTHGGHRLVLHPTDQHTEAHPPAGGVIRGDEGGRAALSTAVDAFLRLVASPGFTLGLFLVDGPLLRPWLVPLAWLGALGAAAAWRTSGWKRLLLAWIALAAVLPTALTGSLPRRSLLAFPLVYVLVGLGVELLLAHWRARRLARGGIALLAATLLLDGGHRLFYRFGLPLKPAGTERTRVLDRPSRPQVAELLRAWGPEASTPVFVSDRRTQSGYLTRVEEIPPEAFTWVPYGRPGAVRRAACSAEPPFRWVDPSDELGALLRANHRVRSERMGAITVHFVESRERGGCAPQ